MLRLYRGSCTLGGGLLFFSLGKVVVGHAAGKIARIRKVVFGEKHMLGGVRTILADRLDKDAKIGRAHV